MLPLSAGVVTQAAPKELCLAGECRPEWTWIALRGERVVGRAVFWAGPEDTEPLALDWLDCGSEIDVGEQLLAAAPFRVEYNIDVRPGWREQPDLRTEVETRLGVARAAGMHPLVERLVYLWTPADGLPERPGRLEFRPEPDDDVLFDALLCRIHTDTLDAHALQDISRGGLAAAAQSELDFMRWMPSPRAWWRLAYTDTGELAGITVPGRNYVTAIKAATDSTNHPMAASFARAGYPLAVERISLDWPS